jgi:hypothetical protein
MVSDFSALVALSWYLREVALLPHLLYFLDECLRARFGLSGLLTNLQSGLFNVKANRRR